MAALKQASPDILLRRAEMERDGILLAQHSEGMAQEQPGILELGGKRVEVLTVSPDEPVSDIPHVFIHGGAWCMGSPRAALGLLRRMAHQCRRPILALTYPLAPEYPYPAAIDTVTAALPHLASRFGIAGIIASSAGCHIALAALVRLHRDGAASRPGGVLLLNPALTQRPDTWTHDAFGVGFGLTSALMAEAYRLYAVPEDDPHGDIAAMNLSRLPPVWIACGDRDPLLSDSLRLYERLIRSSVRAHLEVVPDAVHGFMNRWFDNQRADAAVTHALDWIEACLRRG
jgi:acetyl esterase